MRRFTLSTILLLLVIVLSACGGGNDRVSDPVVPDPVVPDPVVPDPVVPGPVVPDPVVPGPVVPGPVVPDPVVPDPSPTPNKSNLSGSLQISGVGQPGEVVSSELEPNNDVMTANFLGPLTNDISYRVEAGLAIDDSQDVFYFTEAITQSVTVTLTHDASIDFDVQVWDIKPDGTFELIGKSSTATSSEEVRYNTPDGNFTTAVFVTPHEGTGSYELTITSEPITQAASSVTALTQSAVGERVATYTAGSDHESKSLEYVWDVTNFDAVPGEVLAKFRKNVNNVSSFSAKATEHWHDMKQCGEVTGIAILLCDNAAPSAIQSLSSRSSKRDREEAQRRTMARVLSLRANPNVEEVMPNYILRSHVATPNDKLFPLQWHYATIGLPEAWKTTKGSEEVIVAVVDSGITDHPDFMGRLVDGYDFISDAGQAEDGDGLDPDPTEPVTSNPDDPNDWHGTHVAGTIGAATNNEIGVAGVTWQSKIMPVRVLAADGSGATFDILNAVLYAAGLPNGSGTLPNKRANIINLSLGGEGSPAPMVQDTFNRVRAQGVLVIAAAGNDNVDTLIYPASLEGVLSVSAVDLEQKRAFYSNFGSMIDIAAPGGDLGADKNGDGLSDGILSTWLGKSGEYTYDFMSGTSMAAPHVAGVAALLLSVNPDLSVEELENILLSSAKDLGESGRDDLYGHGLLDAAAAVQMATGNAPLPDSFSITPSKVNFGVDDQRLEVTLVSTSLASQEVLIADIETTDGNSWLSASLTPDTITPLVIEIDRNGLAARRYAGRVIISTNLGRYEIQVAMDVTTDIVVPATGEVTLRLIDSTNNSTVMETQTDETKNYNYGFTDVLAGNYYLIAGTDQNNDGRICEIDDFCGAYITLTDPSLIRVADDGSLVNNLDFPLVYQGAGVPDVDPLPDDPAVDLLKPLIGTWDFSYSIESSFFSQRYFLKSIEIVTDGVVIIGADSDGDALIATSFETPVNGYNFSLLEPGKTLDRFYVFNVVADTITGLYWQVDSKTNEFIDINKPYEMRGSRVNEASLANSSALVVDDTEVQEMQMIDLTAKSITTPKSDINTNEQIKIAGALRRLIKQSRKIKGGK